MASALEMLFWQQIVQAKLEDGCEREHQFCPPRKWRLDFAWVKDALAVEIEGGAFVYGRHSRPQGFSADLEKYNHLALLGWHLLRFDAKALNDDDAIPWVRQILRR